MVNDFIYFISKKNNVIWKLMDIFKNTSINKYEEKMIMFLEPLIHIQVKEQKDVLNSDQRIDENECGKKEDNVPTNHNHFLNIHRGHIIKKAITIKENENKSKNGIVPGADGKTNGDFYATDVMNVINHTDGNMLVDTNHTNMVKMMDNNNKNNATEKRTNHIIFTKIRNNITHNKRIRKRKRLLKRKNQNHFNDGNVNENTIKEDNTTTHVDANDILPFIAIHLN